MDNTQLLQDVMNQLVTQPEFKKAEHDAVSTSSKSTSKTRINSDDPVLASLHKEYLCAKDRHNSLVKTLGPFDPMTEVAADALDSASCALETRLIELNCQEDLLHYTDPEHAAALTQKRQSGDKDLRNKLHAFNIQMRKSSKEEKKFIQNGRDSFFWLMFLLWMMRQALDVAQENLSIIQVFSCAAVDYDQAQESEN